MKPTIAVVCPTFNSAAFVRKTLATVVAQTRKPDLLIVSDDGSNDNTVEQVYCYLKQEASGIRWQVLTNMHLGPGAARNAGIRAADCAWISFLDSDDLWEPQKLERVEQAILDCPDANFYTHDESRVCHSGRLVPMLYGRNYLSNRPLPPQLYLSNMFSTSAITCLRDLLLYHGGFNEKLMSAQDYELWLRLSPHIKPIFIHEVLGKYVERKGNITSSNLKRRLKNEVWIALMHRNKVSTPWIVIRLGRIVLSYIRQFSRFKLRV